MLKNGQSAAKLLNSEIEQEEGSTTISQESRNTNSETGETLKFEYKFYIITDPRPTMENKPRYVGKTKQTLSLRINGHISESKLNRRKFNKTNKKESWICKLCDEGYDMTKQIVLIDSKYCTLKEAHEIEKNYILYYANLYDDLLNDDDHGIGLVFGNNKSKYVYQYDSNGTFIKEWFNANVAAIALNGSHGPIHKCCTNENEEGQLTSYGFYWSYIKYDTYPIQKNIKNYKRVYVFDKYKKYIITYNSLKECALELNIDNKIISKHCLNGKKYKNYYYSYSEDMSLNNESKTKIVLQYDINMNFIKEFNSIKEAADEVGLKNATGISQCCKNKQKTAKGYI